MWKTQQNDSCNEHAVKLEHVDQEEFVQVADGCFQIANSSIQQLNHEKKSAISKAKHTIKLPCNRRALLQNIDRNRQELDEYFKTLGQSEATVGKQFLKTELSTAASPAVNNSTIAKMQTQTTLKRDSYDLFFESACASIKSLPPKLAAEAKSRISQIITEFELRAISEQEAEEQKASYGHPIIMSTEPVVDDESAIVYKFQAYS